MLRFLTANVTLLPRAFAPIFHFKLQKR